MKTQTDLTGQAFGRLTVLRYSHRDKYRHTIWECLCECGNLTTVVTGNLRRGMTKSCGCRKKESGGKTTLIHGQSKSPEHRIWCAIKQRCNNPNSADYHNYGGRGIKICKQWSDSFASFITEVGKRPSPGLQLDRIDNDGNYEPGNCRWATPQQQGINRRTSRLLTLNGRTQTLSQWSSETGLHEMTIFHRLGRGWSVEKALTTPPQKQRKAL